MRTYLRIIIILCLTCKGVDALVIDVPDDFLAIQDAIRFSQDGDTVLVQPGSYRGGIDFLGRAIVLLGTPETPEITEIFGSFASVVVFNHCEDERSVINGFTISRGRAPDGGGIVIDNASPIIQNCIITRNSATTAGGGVFVTDESFPVFNNCHFINNRVSRQNGGAIAVFTSSECVLNRCIFTANYAEGRGSAIYGCNGSRIAVNSCTIVFNESQRGGVIYNWNARVTLENTIVWDNGNSPLYSSGNNNTIAYCDIEFGENGVNGDFQWIGDHENTSPQFADFLAGDFSLLPFSPCIDKGNPDTQPDPDGSRADIGAIPANLYETPTFQYQPCSLRFQQTSIGGIRIKDLSVRNTGREQLNVVCDLDNGVFSCMTPQISLAPHQIGVIPFCFTPTEEQVYFCEVRLTTNDPDRQEITLPLFGNGYRSPEVVQPDYNLAVSVDSGRTAESTLNITNDGHGALHWRIEIESQIDEFPGGNQPITNTTSPRPALRNQEVGAILERYEVPFATTSDISWDGELIWGACSQQVIALNSENEILHNLRIFPAPDVMDIVDGEIWTFSNQNPGRLSRHDFNGELITREDTPIDVITGLCFDGHQTVFLMNENQSLYKCHIRSLNNPEYLGQLDPIQRDGYICKKLTFVPKHYGGQLWTITGRELDNSFYLTRMSIGILGDLETVANFPFASGQYSGLAHDGNNLLWGGDGRHMNWFALQDGIPESEWLNVDPMAGILAPEADEDVFLSISGCLPPGLYQNKIHIKSNDPEFPDVQVNINMTVTDPEDVIINYGSCTIPDQIMVLPNFPNPFNSSTQIRFSLPRSEKASVQVFNTAGALVETLLSGTLPAGWHTINWHCRKIPSGVYFARLTMGSESFTIKMSLLE